VAKKRKVAAKERGVAAKEEQEEQGHILLAKRMKISVRRQAVDRLIYGQLRSCTDLLWTAIHAPDSPWYNDTGELVACPGEVQRPLCTSNGGNMYKGGLVINFKDGGEICICISHVGFVPDQKPVPSAPIAYAVNKGTYAGHTFTCLPSKGASLCLVPL
jgi:hypothetical protein